MLLTITSTSMGPVSPSGLTTSAIINESLNCTTFAVILDMITDTSVESSPKLVPRMVISSPTKAVSGVIDEICGVGSSTVNEGPLIVVPRTVTDTTPDVAPSGTAV